MYRHNGINSYTAEEWTDMSNVVSICQPPKFFTLEEADELVPLISRITKQDENRIQKLLDVQRYLLKSGAPRNAVVKVDAEVGQILVGWGTKLTKLGCKVFGGGYVGFDNGAGFFSWHNGDRTIKYFHGYLESPMLRREVIREQKVQSPG